MLVNILLQRKLNQNLMNLGQQLDMIIALGKNVSEHKIGDLVMSIMKYGGYKSEVVVPSENTYKVPSNMCLDIAAGFPVTFGQLSPFVAIPTLFVAQLVLFSSADVAVLGG